MSSYGPQMMGEWYGSAWNDRKMAKIRLPKVAAAAVFAGPIQVRPAAVGREISRPRSYGGGAPPWLARVARGWSESAPTAKTRMA